MNLKTSPILSAVFFALLMLFLFYDPVQRTLTGWFGSRAYFPWTTAGLTLASLIPALAYFFGSFAVRQDELFNVLLSLPIVVFLAYFLGLAIGIGFS